MSGVNRVNTPDAEAHEKDKRSSSLRSSFKRLFHRRKERTGSLTEANLNTSVSSTNSSANVSTDYRRGDVTKSLPRRPVSVAMAVYYKSRDRGSFQIADTSFQDKESLSTSTQDSVFPDYDFNEEFVSELQRQIRIKDQMLKEIKAESTESLRQITKMFSIIETLKTDLSSVRADNARLRRMITNNSEQDTTHIVSV